MTCNAVVIGAFAIVRSLLPRHSPDVRLLVVTGKGYAAPRLGYLFLWFAGGVIASTVLAAVLGSDLKPVARLRSRLAHQSSIRHVSTWWHIDEQTPAGHFVYLGCDMRDGAFVGGLLDWYNTSTYETADRELALAAPITYRPPNDPEHRVLNIERLVISNREIVRMLVSYVRSASGETSP